MEVDCRVDVSNKRVIVEFSLLSKGLVCKVKCVCMRRFLFSRAGKEKLLWFLARSEKKRNTRVCTDTKAYRHCKAYLHLPCAKGLDLEAQGSEETPRLTYLHLTCAYPSSGIFRLTSPPFSCLLNARAFESWKRSLLGVRKQKLRARKRHACALPLPENEVLQARKMAAPTFPPSQQSEV